MSAGRTSFAGASASHRTDAWIEKIDPAPVIAFCAVFALVLFLPPILNDADTLWQIRTGEWILDHHAIPHTDPFSFTTGGRAWYAHEWLAETLMALCWRTMGMVGVMVLAAAATGLTAAIVLYDTRRFLPGIYALLALVIAFSNAAPSMLARPHLLAWPCLAIWCGGIAAARARQAAPSFWLLPVMLIWVNLHGSFIVGLLLSGAFMVEALCDRGADLRRVLTGWGAFVLGSCVVVLLNPDFVAGALFPIRMIGMKSLAWIGEWEPVDFGRIQLLELMILGGLALGFSGQVRLPPIRMLILLGLVHGALSHARNGQLLGLVGVLILAEPFGAALGRGKAATPARPWSQLAAVAVLLGLAALAGRIMLPLEPTRTGEAFAAVIEQIPAALRVRRVLNDYGLGGPLIFHGERPFIDSRADLYGDAFLAEYRAISSGDRGALDRALSAYGIAWTIFPAAMPVVAALDQTPGWRRLMEADGFVIHINGGQAAR